MAAMKRTKLVMVGACAVDTILTVPYFPAEDSKLRATSLVKRRGGNAPNSLSVLQQLIDEETGPELFLIATLPARNSVSTAFIASSFDRSASQVERQNPIDATKSPPKIASVNLKHCIFREDSSDPVSSYILYNSATASRTIVNHNALNEMTLSEFITTTESLLDLQSSSEEERFVECIWFHFEGRIPVVILECIRYLRKHCIFQHMEDSADRRPPQLKISVELEKPGREGLQQLAHEADVIFYSKSWAEGEGYPSAQSCLQEQAKLLAESPYRNASERTLICTWGEQGACGLVLNGSNSVSESIKDIFLHSLAWKPEGSQQIMDSTGAGDTFIAGILYGMMTKGRWSTTPEQWWLRQVLDFANFLAGHKILQQGFDGLGILANELG